jgi:hypothetical protein
MGAKEKAKELVEKFTAHSYHNDNVQQCFDHAKQSALIAVDEILDLKHIVTLRRNMHEMELEFWAEVKQEIENL